MMDSLTTTADLIGADLPRRLSRIDRGGMSEPGFFFKRLDPALDLGFKEWARTHWRYSDGVKEGWHPAVRAEIGRLLLADAREELRQIERERA